MISLDKVNPADRPETTVEQVARDMIDQGAQLDLRDLRRHEGRDRGRGAAEHPDVPMIWSSGDSAWAEGKGYRPDLTNLGNMMGRMEYGKMMAGCAAALTTETGKIGYLGPLINDETRRLANSVYLGARYCWENYRGKDPADLSFSVNWIGFWFNIPGVTLDPTQVANDFFDGGADVVISGIDTTEALVVAGQRAGARRGRVGRPYDYEGACAEAPDICLGVPYFNWGPAYLQDRQVGDRRQLRGARSSGSVRTGPTSTTRTPAAIGFVKGSASRPRPSRRSTSSSPVSPTDRSSCSSGR